MIGGTLPTQFGFNGNRVASGFYDYGARWYDPAMSRFVQPDPVIQDPFDPQGLSRYSYARNDPANRIDPTGAQSCDLGGCGGAPPTPNPADYGITPFDPLSDHPGPSFGGGGSIGGRRASGVDYASLNALFAALNSGALPPGLGAGAFATTQGQVPYGPNPMISAAGVQFIKQWEAFRPNLYPDQAGNCTIGYGHLVNEGPCGSAALNQFGGGLSESSAADLLASDIVERADPAIRKIGVALSQNQVDALTSFVFNVGHMPRSVQRALNLGSFDRVPAIFSRFKFAGPVVSGGLIRRRAAEGALFAGP